MEVVETVVEPTIVLTAPLHAVELHEAEVKATEDDVFLDEMQKAKVLQNQSLEGNRFVDQAASFDNDDVSLLSQSNDANKLSLEDEEKVEHQTGLNLITEEEKRTLVHNMSLKENKQMVDKLDSNCMEVEVRVEPVVSGSVELAEEKDSERG